MSDLLDELRPEDEDSALESAWASAFGQEAQPQPDEGEVDQTIEQPEEAVYEERPRDEQGRFVRVDQPQVDEGQPEQPAEPDAFQQTLQKYGGDPEAAVRGLLELDAMRSRQSNELGDLRQEVAQLRAAQMETGQPQQYARPITEADIEALDELSYTNGQQAFIQAMQLDPSGQVATRVLDTWSTNKPAEAMLFLSSQMADTLVTQRTAELEAKYGPLLENHAQTAQDQQFVGAWTALAQDRPEIEQLTPAMLQILEERPAFARQFAGADEATTRDLLSTLVDSASMRQQPVVQEQIAGIQAEQQAAARQQKVGAAVAKPNGQVGSVPGGSQPELTAAQQEAQRIKEGIMGSADTSIQAGWTTE